MLEELKTKLKDFIYRKLFAKEDIINNIWIHICNIGDLLRMYMKPENKKNRVDIELMLHNELLKFKDRFREYREYGMDDVEMRLHIFDFISDTTKVDYNYAVALFCIINTIIQDEDIDNCLEWIKTTFMRTE